MRKKKGRPKTWAGIIKQMGHKGILAKELALWIAERHDVEGRNIAFTKKEIMEAHNLDYTNRNDYARVSKFFSNHKKLLTGAMVAFWGSADYHKYNDEGMSELDKYNRMIEAAVSYSVFPMWADRTDNNRYHIIGYNDYVEIQKKRFKALETELVEKQKDLSIVAQEFPKLAGETVSSLLADPERNLLEPGDMGATKLLVERSGINEKGDNVCQECKRRYVLPSQLIAHMNKTHLQSSSTRKPDINTFPCPLCGARDSKKDKRGLFRELESGDYKCRECNAKPITEEEIRSG